MSFILDIMSAIEFIKQFPIQTFEPGELLLQPGDTTDKLLAIREGYVKVGSIGSSGNEHLLLLAGRYDVVPTERLFSSRGEIRYFYTALTAGSVYVIDKAALLEEAKQNPDLMGQVARGMSQHYDDFLERLDSSERSSVRERLIYTLRYLGERLSSEETVDFYDYGLPLTHKDLAGMIGATRETTSVTLSQLRADGMITYDRTHFTVYLDKLAEENQ